MIATANATPRNNPVSSIKRQGSIWNSEDIPKFSNLSPPTSDSTPPTSNGPLKSSSIPNFSKHRRTDSITSNRASTSTQGSQKSISFKDEPTVVIDNGPSPRSTLIPSSAERKLSKVFSRKSAPKPITTLPKAALKKTSVYEKVQSLPPKEPEVHKAEVVEAHRGSIVEQSHRPSLSGTSELSPTDAYQKMSSANRKPSVSYALPDENYISRVSSGTSNGYLEAKINRMDDKIDVLVPAIDRLSRAIDLLSSKLDSMSRPATRGNDSNTVVSSGFTAAWRDHNNSFLSQQQLRRPSNITVSRRPSTQPSVTTPRSVTFRDDVLKPASDSDLETDDERVLREVAELNEEEAETALRGPKRRSRQMSRWDTETEEETEQDSEADSDSEGIGAQALASPPAPAPSPIAGPPIIPPEPLKVSKKPSSLAQRRPTGWAGKNSVMMLPDSVPPTPTTPIAIAVQPSGAKSKSVPTAVATHTPTAANISKAISKSASVPAIPKKSASKITSKSVSNPLTQNPVNVPSSDSAIPTPRASISGKRPSIASSSTKPAPITVKPPTQALPQPPSEPTTPAKEEKEEKHGINWTWGWPKRVVSGAGRLGSVSLNLPPTPVTPTFPVPTTNQAAIQERKASTIASRQLTPPSLPPPRPNWYFFAGRAADPLFLRHLLDLEHPPSLLPAKVWGHKVKYHAEGGKVAVEGAVTESVDGAAWYVPQIEMATWLREWWGSNSEGLTDGFVEVSVEIEFEEGEEKRGRMRKRWDESEDESDAGKKSDGVVVGRMFVWRGDLAALSDNEADA